MNQFLFSLKITLLLLFVATSIQSQERYKEEITDSVRMDTYTYAFKDNQSLDLDIFTPAFDNQSNRPLILYMHGGGFSGGARNEPGIQEFCRKLARHGYVAVSMSYRLTRAGTATAFGCDCPAVDKLNTFNEAVEDIQDATFFLIKNRDKMGIDPHKIILSGSSAGAEAVLNAAYQPPSCYGLESGPVSYAGVISMAGAIPDTSRIYEESAVPSLLFHGTCDDLVPYASASHHYCKPDQPGYLVLHGAYTIAQKLKQTQTPYWLYTYCNAAHEIAGIPMTNNFNDIIDFCYSFVLNKNAEQRVTVKKSDLKPCKYQTFNFCNE
ncbi:MAG: alpha/beta hydrolase [Bacteroidales bacterium]